MIIIDVPNNSFTFGSFNSLLVWGIKVIAYDVFSAKKRSRSQVIPFRHGQYDYGDKFFEPKTIRLECNTTRVMSKAEMREVVYQLTRKNRIYLWDEPDKYYIGELMESADVEVLQRYVQQKFTLPFVCEPFAYGAMTHLPLDRTNNILDYRGTAETPTLITIKNPNDFPISGVMITAVRQIKVE